jgi:hypothetical protein
MSEIPLYISDMEKPASGLKAAILDRAELPRQRLTDARWSRSPERFQNCLPPRGLSHSCPTAIIGGARGTRVAEPLRLDHSRPADGKNERLQERRAALHVAGPAPQTHRNGAGLFGFWSGLRQGIWRRPAEPNLWISYLCQLSSLIT